MSLLHGPSAGAAKSNLLAELRKTGGVRLEAGYSGGNDEGGVTSVRILDADGKQLEGDFEYITREKQPGDSEWMIRDDGLYHGPHAIWEAADEMLSTEFYTWAGEFSAWGTLYATLSDGKVWRDGQYEVPTSDDSYNEY